MDQTACCTCATLLSHTPRVIASSSSSPSSSLSEKERPLPDGRQLECCGRVICGGCIHTNPRFGTYCPYCQTPSAPSNSSSGSPLPLPPRFSLLASHTRRLGLAEEEEPKDPPRYQISISPTFSLSPPPPPATEVDDEPPPYTAEAEAEPEPEPTAEPDDKQQPPSYNTLNNSIDLIDGHSEKKKPVQDQDNSDDEDGEPILHFLHHPNDTISSLSLRYDIPPQILRSFNRLIGSDHLLLGRQTILIPRPHHYHQSYQSYQLNTQYEQQGQHQQHALNVGNDKKAGSKNKQKMPMTSLSPRPIYGEEEEARRSKIRRWMVTCKCPDYDVALIYLSQADYDLDAATANYFADEAWERDHPIHSGTGIPSSSGGNAMTTKIRDYHQQRLSRRIPASLLQTSMNW